MDKVIRLGGNSKPLVTIGRYGEYNVSRIIFDISRYIELYGEGHAELVVKNPGTDTLYAQAVRRNCHHVIWDITAANTVNQGYGVCVLRWYTSKNGLAKSEDIQVLVANSADTGITGDMPDIIQDWLDQVADEKNEFIKIGNTLVRNASEKATAANASATTAETYARVATSQASVATEQAEIAKTASDNASQQARVALSASENANVKAELAEASATIAREHAELAKQATIDASSQASIATNAADVAKAKADVATEQADNAAVSAEVAETAANIAISHASTATNASTEALKQSGIATAAANTATSKANVATTAANTATSQSQSALTAAYEASSYAKQSKDNYEKSSTYAANAKKYSEIAQAEKDDATAQANKAEELATQVEEQYRIVIEKAEIAANASDTAVTKAVIATTASENATAKAAVATEKAEIAANASSIATEKAAIAVNAADTATAQAAMVADASETLLAKADIAIESADKVAADALLLDEVVLPMSEATENTKIAYDLPVREYDVLDADDVYTKEEIDQKNSQLSESIADFRDSISEYHKSVNLFDKGKITDNKILGGQNKEQTINGCFFTDYIPVKTGTYCFQDNTGYLGQNGKVICTYDGDKNFLSSVNLSEVTVRDGAVIFPIVYAKYVRVNGRTSRIDSFMLVEGDTLPSYEPYYEPYYEIKREVLPQMPLPSNAEYNPLYGKKIALNGDSICYGAGSTGGFGKIIADANNMSMSNIAVSGGTLATGTIIQGVNRHWISNTIQNMPTDADYYILDGGINDADTSLGVTLGEMTSGYGSTFDTTTLSGAMESICYQLQTRFKGKKYGFVFAHNCYPYTGRWTTEFRPRMKEILKKWGIPYLDLSEECPQLRNIDALRIYTASGDGWHPTEEGYKLFYVPKITAWMKTL